jgi:hypothetical protein
MNRLSASNRFMSCLFSAIGLVGCAVADEPQDDRAAVSTTAQSLTGNCPANAGQYSFHFDNGMSGGFGPHAGTYASGWVFDNNDPGRSVDLVVWTVGGGIDFDCGYFVANQQRDDVNSYCGTTGAHGFSFVVPSGCNRSYVLIDADYVENLSVGIN